MANNQFTLTMKHYYQYRDDRLAITENVRGGRIYLDSEKYSGKLLWNPRVVFSNLEKVISEKTASDILYASELAEKRGFNVRPAKFTEMRFNCPINVRKFPFDVQQLSVIVTSFS